MPIYTVISLCVLSIKDQELIVGLEADLEEQDTFFDGIGVNVNGKIKSVCNWAFAAAPKQMLST